MLKHSSTETPVDRKVSKHYPKYNVPHLYEASCLGDGIYHALSKAGWPFLIGSPPDVSKGNKQSITKVDKVNSVVWQNNSLPERTSEGMLQNTSSISLLWQN